MVDFAIGILVGGLLYWLLFDHKKATGTFVIDFRDPMKDVCRIELGENLNQICRKKRIMFNVKYYEDNSQE